MLKRLAGYHIYPSRPGHWNDLVAARLEYVDDAAAHPSRSPRHGNLQDAGTAASSFWCVRNDNATTKECDGLTITRRLR
jgi:hypothetical protein